MNVPLN